MYCSPAKSTISRSSKPKSRSRAASPGRAAANCPRRARTARPASCIAAFALLEVTGGQRYIPSVEEWYCARVLQHRSGWYPAVAIAPDVRSMLAVRRARLLSTRPLGLTLLGALVTVAALVVDEATGAGCGWPTVLLYVAAGAVLASLPVRLPGGSISLLPAVLLPAWLSCGMAVTSTIVVAAVLLASTVVRAGILTTLLAGAAALAGVFVGDLLGWLALSLTPLAGIFPEPVVASIAFAIGVWAGELTITRLAVSGGMAGEARALAGASLIANLLLVFPGTILAEVLATRGVTLFAL